MRFWPNNCITTPNTLYRWAGKTTAIDLVTWLATDITVIAANMRAENSNELLVRNSLVPKWRNHSKIWRRNYNIHCLLLNSILTGDHPILNSYEPKTARKQPSKHTGSRMVTGWIIRIKAENSRISDAMWIEPESGYLTYNIPPERTITKIDSSAQPQRTDTKRLSDQGQ